MRTIPQQKFTDVCCTPLWTLDQNWHTWTSICGILAIQPRAKVSDSHCSVQQLPARYPLGWGSACILGPADAMSDGEGRCGSRMSPDQQGVFLTSTAVYVHSAEMRYMILVNYMVIPAQNSEIRLNVCVWYYNLKAVNTSNIKGQW
jgi:hypothetical protein